MYRKVFFSFLCFLCLAGCGSANAGLSPTPTHGFGFRTPTAVADPTGTPNWGHQTKTSGCIGYGPGMALADPGCTPGAILNVTATQVCMSGYSKSVRNVTQATKDAVYAEYGIKIRTPGEYEVDHYVAIEDGGSNDISNLWPEPALPVPGFHQKDTVENYLHGGICAGKISILQAEIDLSTNWLAVYNAMPVACKQPYPATGCVYTTSSSENGQ